MSERLETAFISMRFGSLVPRSQAESLLAERDATIAQQAEQLEALAEQCEKMRKVIAKSRELVCAGAECGFNPIPSKWADELFYNQAD